MRQFELTCPQCHVVIQVPFMKELEAKALADYDLAELSAQEELFTLKWWLANASLFNLLKSWIRRKTIRLVVK